MTLKEFIMTTDELKVGSAPRYTDNLELKVFDYTDGEEGRFYNIKSVVWVNDELLVSVSPVLRRGAASGEKEYAELGQKLIDRSNPLSREEEIEWTE